MNQGQVNPVETKETKQDETTSVSKDIWLANLNVKCITAVEAMDAVYNYLDVLEHVLPGMSDDDVEELYAVVNVKLQKMFEPRR